jgi:ribonuclease P protein component
MSSARFRRFERLTREAEFRRAYERRRSASDELMVVYGVENGQSFARLGLSVSRRKFRTAVARNRVKRLLREAFRLSKAELPPGVDLVVVPRPAPLTLAAARRSLPRLAQAVARRLGQPGGRPAP